jgi:uncharacterized protein
MIRRSAQPHIEEAARRYPIVTVTGPRQSGKTTLCRAAFPEKAYVSLEAPDVRQYAQSDPRGLLAEFAEGAIFDEVQRVPDLLSYLQVEVDANPQPGRFVLTGSQHLGLLQSVTQSLAGRTNLLALLPFGLDELRRFEAPIPSLFETLWRGSYPPIHDRDLPPQEWLGAYVATYVERDVRQVLGVGDLGAFQAFVGLCAGRTGQLLNLSSLGNDCGITHNTARSWLSVLEAGYLVFRLRPHHRNLGKRLIKTPKLYFFDSGLLCYLLGIREPDQLRHHPLRGAIFENWVVSEVYKTRVHAARQPDLYFHRDRKGHEVDLLVDRGSQVTAAEIKAGETVAADFFAGLDRFAESFSDEAASLDSVLVYGGGAPQKRSNARVIPWSDLDAFEWVRTAPTGTGTPRPE